MKLNIGGADRLARIFFALVIAALYVSEQLSGTAALILGLIAVIFVFTGSIGFCPAYAPFHFSTRKDNSAS